MSKRIRVREYTSTSLVIAFWSYFILIFVLVATALPVDVTQPRQTRAQKAAANEAKQNAKDSARYRALLARLGKIHRLAC